MKLKYSPFDPATDDVTLGGGVNTFLNLSPLFVLEEPCGPQPPLARKTGWRSITIATRTFAHDIWVGPGCSDLVGRSLVGLLGRPFKGTSGQ